MLRIALPGQQRLSITQYCLVATLIVAGLGFYSGLHSISLIDRYIEYILLHRPESYETFLSRYNDEGWVVSVGEFLRNAKLPLTEYSAIGDSHPATNALLEQLYDVRAGLIYLWAFMLVSLLGCMVWLTNSVRRPFNAIANAIGKLAQSKLDQSVSLVGPRNVLEVSDELEGLRCRLQHNERQRTLFLRHVSHEIKTPLASIKEGITLLDDESLGNLTDDQRDVTNILKRASDELQNSIEDLLTYNSFASARNQQNLEPVNLTLLLEDTITKHQLTIQRNQFTLRKVLKNIVSRVARNQMETVFDNLLSNAFKYAPHGSEIRLWLKRNSYGHIEFTIRDQGSGVTKEHRKEIFDAFYKGDEPINALVEGTGLGLTLAKQYVEAHNGSIRLIETRKGATFKLSINPSNISDTL